MRDELNSKIPDNIECGVVNMDSSKREGTHNCCYQKNGNEKYYFDSFGLIPQREVITYLKFPIMYSTFQIQQFNDSNCSEWSLFALDK